MALILAFRSTEEELFICHIHNYTSSEMCSLHLTHPSAHTPGAVDTHTHTHTHTHTPHTHLEQWTHTPHTHTHTPGAVGSRGSSRGFGALLKGLTSVVDNSCRSQDSNPQPRVTSPTLYPLEPRLPQEVQHAYYLVFECLLS